MRLQLTICHKKKLLHFFNKIRAITQQVLPVQTGLYWYDEWMLQIINDENLNGS